MASTTPPQQLNLELLLLSHSKEGVLCDHFFPFLTARDVGRLEGVSQAIRSVLVCEEDSSRPKSIWKILWDRDFDRDGALSTRQLWTTMNRVPLSRVPPHPPEDPSNNSNEYRFSIKCAPVYNNNNNINMEQEQLAATFQDLVDMNTWKESYKAWSIWKHRTRGFIYPPDLIWAVNLWNRFKTWLALAQRANPSLHLEQHILSSLQMGLTVQDFTSLLLTPNVKSTDALSSLLAFQSVHKAQSYSRQSRWSGVFGSCCVYNTTFSMYTVAATNLVSNILAVANVRESHALLADRENSQLYVASRLSGLVVPVGTGGLLSYFQTFVERLEDGVYKATCIIPTVDATGGISLFPDADLGDGSLSCCITHGMEVKASARWMYENQQQNRTSGLNFAYSIRIQMVDDNESVPWETCQLVGRHWQFTDGWGQIREVSGEAVIGKQPLFFRSNGKSGFVDLGPDGTDRRFDDRVFVYQSQTGPVVGTTQQDTGQASIQGSFSFVPGSIVQPTGPMFHVRVAPFRLTVPFPFY